MKVSVNVTSQGRILEGSLFFPPDALGALPALLFEGSMTGATQQITEYLAKEISQHGFVCMVLNHSYFGDDEAAAQPWESPTKRVEDIKAAIQVLRNYSGADQGKIVGVGVSIGAEFLAQACRETHIFRGFVMIQGPFDDSQNIVKDLDVPSVVIDETHLDTAVDETVLWVRTLFNGRFPEDLKVSAVDWSQRDK